MASVNKVILVGRLGRDPETRFTSDNSLQITSFSVATSSYRKSPSGERIEETEWHNISCFGRQAEIAQQYLRKGKEVYVEGRIRTRKWEKDGVTHYRTEIIADSFQMFGSAQGTGPAEGGASGGYSRPAGNNSDFETATPRSAPRSQPAAPAPDPGIDDMADDVPF